MGTEHRTRLSSIIMDDFIKANNKMVVLNADSLRVLYNHAVTQYSDYSRKFVHSVAEGFGETLRRVYFRLDDPQAKRARSTHESQSYHHKAYHEVVDADIDRLSEIINALHPYVRAPYEGQYSSQIRYAQHPHPAAHQPYAPYCQSSRQLPPSQFTSVAPQPVHHHPIALQLPPPQFSSGRQLPPLQTTPFDREPAVHSQYYGAQQQPVHHQNPAVLNYHNGAPTSVRSLV